MQSGIYFTNPGTYEYLDLDFFFHINVILPENLECPTYPDGSVGPTGDTIFKSLFALPEKQHDIVYQVRTMEYQAPFV